MRRVILHNLVEDLLIYNENSPYKRINRKVNRIDNDYFDQIDCSSEVLPVYLTPALRDKVVDDFRRELASMLDDDLMQDVIDKVKANSVLDVEPADYQSLARYLRTHGECMPKLVESPQITEAEINKLYEDAKKRTLDERVMQSNKNDVIRFHHALQTSTVWHVRALVQSEFGKFMCLLADRVGRMGS